ncbi:MAG: urease accessory protein UreE [Paracoccaceae bacterium]|nr:urease accessory protein UreE [Paracoccaceae bacterium]
MIRATTVTSAPDDPDDTITLQYDDRCRRRIVLTSDSGLDFLLDLPRAARLRDGDALVLEDGRAIQVRAGSEELMEARSADSAHLVRAAWHVGNRHCLCEVHADRLVMRRDQVVCNMLKSLGCTVTDIIGPFDPEGGAYSGQHGHHQHE